ncbi:MAG: biotin-dependent carboxyltransferase family protein, partial [Actinobacteria bacterium]|nr:biotin-dependent carboxyltransferase family protein [Actinomycetota bacterium]
AGTVLAFGTPTAGLRSYLAVRGGLAVPAVLGSRATDTLSGLGPPALTAGQRLPVGTSTAGPPGTGGDTGAALGAQPVALRLAAGPRADWFDAGPLHAAGWRVRPDSDRIGTRLAGPELRVLPGFERLAGELPSEPTLPGAVQVPPDGQPIVLGPDAPVTGGYPVVGVLAAADLDLLAQLRPGAVLRFVSLPTGPRYAAAGRPR